jgi:hypothetical protein
VLLIFLIVGGSVFRFSRPVMRVVTTGRTIEIVGNESTANFLVAASNGSNIN